MKKLISILAIIFILIIFQTGFLAPWFPEYGYPDAVLMFLIASVAAFGFYPVWRWAILAGIIFDIFAYSKPGTHVIIFILAIYAISFISRRMLVNERSLGIVLVVLFIFPITLWERWGFYFLDGGRGIIFSQANLSHFLPMVFWNIILFFVSMLIIGKIKRFFGPQEYKIVRN